MYKLFRPILLKTLSPNELNKVTYLAFTHVRDLAHVLITPIQSISHFAWPHIHSHSFCLTEERLLFTDVYNQQEVESEIKAWRQQETDYQNHLKSTNVSWSHFEYVNILYYLAYLHLLLPKKNFVYIKETLEKAQKELGKFPYRGFNALDTKIKIHEAFGMLAQYQGEKIQTIEVVKQSLKEAGKNPRFPLTYYADLHANLGMAYAVAEQIKKAVQSYQKAINAVQTINSTAPLRLAANQSILLLFNKDLTSAKELQIQSLKGYEKLGATQQSPLEIAIVWHNLAMTLIQEHDLDQAKYYLEKFNNLCEKTLKPNHPLLTIATQNIETCPLLSKKYDNTTMKRTL